jgi:hypothetical protein
MAGLAIRACIVEWFCGRRSVRLSSVLALCVCSGKSGAVGRLA